MPQLSQTTTLGKFVMNGSGIGQTKKRPHCLESRLGHWPLSVMQEALRISAFAHCDAMQSKATQRMVEALIC